MSFTANSAQVFRTTYRGWQARRLGYMTVPTLGYALAVYTWMRGDVDPDWATHLATNPHDFLTKGLKYLSRAAAEVLTA